MCARIRVDALLLERGLFTSRERARAALLAGEVSVDGVPVEKPGQQVRDDAVVEVAERRRFVSRGGEKLAGALATFAVEVAGRRALDVGASTGGFTDCLLQQGVSHVVAVDVGYGQLAWSLRTDPRVTLHERTNIRAATRGSLGGPFGLIVVDVSFISLKTVLPALLSLLDGDGDLLALVKPQFEAGKARVGKRGVVRDPRVHEDVLASVAASVEEAGLVVRGFTFSPITGPHGNIEFWVWAAQKGVATTTVPAEVVAKAHAELGG